MNKKFIGKNLIRRELEVDVDAFRKTNYYKIVDLFDYVWSDKKGEWATVETEVIDEFSYTWEAIERDGGIAQVNREVKELYGITE